MIWSLANKLASRLVALPAGTINQQQQWWQAQNHGSLTGRGTRENEEGKMARIYSRPLHLSARAPQDVDPGGASRVRMGRGEQISWTLPSGAVAELKMNLGLESAREKERKTGRAARQPCPLR